MNTRTQAPTWQRIFCGLLCIASAAMLVSEISGVLPNPLHHTAHQLLEAYGTYVFGHITLTGRVPGFKHTKEA